MKPKRHEAASPASPPEISAEHRVVLTDAYKAGVILSWRRDVDRGYCLALAGRADQYVEPDQLTKYLERLRARWRRPELACAGETIAMPRMPSKSFPCSVISEAVTITLQRRLVVGGAGKLFVRCSERDCQYVDRNEPPCPLTIELFRAEIEFRMAPRVT
jgi:hypothetical protein